MNKTQTKQIRRYARHARIRARVSGTADRPRLTVFRSNRAIYAQLIDDDAHKTLTTVDSRKSTGANASERAAAVGKEVADKAKKVGITKVVFDRGGYRYQGAIAALADSARENGLTF
ncbi:MAG: 50S ribosomal protein L18 [Candidatus Paceibacterota bacterium]